MGDNQSQRAHDGPRWTDVFARIVLARPWTVIVLSLVLGAAGAVFGWFRLPLDANTDSLIARDRPWMKGYLGFIKEFGDLEYLYVVVDTKGDRATGEQAVDDVLERLHAMGDLPGVHGRIEPEEMWRLTTRAASDEELRGLALARGALPVLAGVDDWLTAAEQRLQKVTTGVLTGLSESEQAELGAAGVLLLDAVAATGEAARGNTPTLEFAAPRAPEYLASDTGRLLFVGILPRKDFATLAAIEGPLERIRAAVALTAAKFPSVDIGLTGKPVLQADELITSTGDTTISFAVGLAVVAGLCVVIYRDWRRPLLAVIAFAIAIGWTQGAAALFVGRLTLLSMVFLLVLIGAGLDYGIHVVSRYTEFRATLDIRESVRRTMRTAAPGTLTGAATSAAVFILAIFSDFGGLRELGVIAGSGLVLCAIAMVTTLPALLVVFDSARTPKPAIDIPVPWPSVGTSTRSARIAVAIFAALLVGSAVAIPLGFRFESNLLKLQSPDLESVRWERRVLADSASLSWFAAVQCDDESQVLATIDRAKLEPEIGFIRSVFDVVRPSTPEREALRASIAALELPAPVEQLPSVVWTAARLSNAGSRLRGMATLAAHRASAADLARLKSIAARLDAFAGAFGQTDDAALFHRRDAARHRIGDAARAIVVGAKVPLRDAIPDAVRARFVSPSGKMLVQLIPKADTWEYEPLKSFVAAIRRVDANATGVPITQSESITDMIHAFITISLWSVVAVALITWFDFRRLSAIALCTGTLLVGIALTLGLLAALGVPLSLANFFGIPILIGLGIDSNIHLLHRAHETHRTGSPDVEFGATRGAVVFTALTTAIGFGGQIFASHQGMQALGWIMVVGSLVCLATSVWLLPALLRLMPVQTSSSSSTPSGNASRNARP